MKNLYCCIIFILIIWKYAYNQNFDQLFQFRGKSCVEVGDSNALGKQGIWLSYSKKDHVLLSKRNYINDTLNGWFEEYYNNGQLSALGFFHNGMLDSTLIGFDIDGDTASIFNYYRNTWHGVEKWFYNKKLAFRFKYNFGIFDSLWPGNFIDSDYEKRTLKFTIKKDTVRTLVNQKYSEYFIREDSLYYIHFYKNNILRIVSVYNDYYPDNPYFNPFEIIEKRIYFKRKPYRLKYIFNYKDKLKTRYYYK